MELITTTAMVSTIVDYLAKTLKDNKSVQDFFSDFTATTVDWVRPVFLKDENQYEKIIADLVNKPDSPIKQQQVETAIASHLEDNPADEQHLKAMYEQLQAKATTDKSIRIVNSKNVVTGTMKAGGNIIIGDNNTSHTPR